MLRESDIDNDDLREELEDINNKIMLNPNNADLYYEKTEILMYMEDYEAALESINNFIILEPIEQAGYIIKYKVLLGLRRHDDFVESTTEQLETINRLIELMPGGINSIEDNDYKENFYFYKFTCLRDLGEEERALEALNNAIEVQPQDAELYYYKAKYLINLGRDNEALQVIQESILLSNVVDEELKEQINEILLEQRTSYNEIVEQVGMLGEGMNEDTDVSME